MIKHKEEEIKKEEEKDLKLAQAEAYINSIEWDHALELERKNNEIESLKHALL